MAIRDFFMNPEARAKRDVERECAASAVRGAQIHGPRLTHRMWYSPSLGYWVDFPTHYKNGVGYVERDPWAIVEVRP